MYTNHQNGYLIYKQKMCEDYVKSLYTGDIYISPKTAKEQRDSILPVRVINEHNRIVNYCQNRIDAKQQIEKRNNALILLGRCPKEYRIITKIIQGEYTKGKNHYVFYR